MIFPRPVSSPYINYIVLSVAMAFETGSWWIAFQELRKVKGEHGYFEAVRLSKDPTVFTILFDDTTAMLGLIVAFIGLLLDQLLDERLLAEESDIVRLNELFTMHFGPNDIPLNVSLDFADRLSSTEVENHVSELAAY